MKNHFCADPANDILSTKYEETFGVKRLKFLPCVISILVFLSSVNRTTYY